MTEKPSETLEGGCACSAVRYEVIWPPDFALQCGCRKCQRASGGGHSSSFVVNEKALQISGELRFFEQPSDSGHPTRSGFCPTCGSPVMNLASRFPESRYLHAATLDDPARFAPSFVVFREQAPPWDLLDPELK